MTIGIVFPVGHHGEGDGAGGPTPELPDGRRLLFDQDLFGRWGWLLLFQLAEFFLPLFLPFADGLGPGVNGFLDLLFPRFALYPVDVRLPEQRHRIDIEIHVAANRDADIDAVLLLADGDRLAIQEPPVKDEPPHHPFAPRLDT